MKLCNLASFDPALQARGIKGLQRASRADWAMWESFSKNWNEMSEKSEQAFESLMGEETSQAFDNESSIAFPNGSSETERPAKVRRHQTFFRNTVLASYEYRCALTGLAIPKLLVASHIIPWSQNEERRTDPTNGLCLNALHDRAFDRHLITFDEDFRLIVSDVLKSRNATEFQSLNFIRLEGSKLSMPHRFMPDRVAIEEHRKQLI